MSSTTTLQCPQCGAPIDPSGADSESLGCKACGALLAPAAGGQPLKATAPARSRSFRISFFGILLCVLFLLMAAFSVGAGLMAVRTAEERTRAKENFANALAGIDQVMLTVCTSSKLKGAAHDAERDELLGSLLQYYEGFVAKHASDRKMHPQLMTAYLHIAVIKAKRGSIDAPTALRQANDCILAMTADKVDPDLYPNLQAASWKLTVPQDWITLKGEDAKDLRNHATRLILVLEFLSTSLTALSQEHPQTLGFRDDFAATRRVVAFLYTLIGQNGPALKNWLTVRDEMEKLVSQLPANADYKNRLAESLLAAGRIQRTSSDKDAAIASFQRAVEVREQLASGNPDDKTLQVDLKVAKRELEKLKPAQAAGDNAPPPAQPSGA
jgi:hypothetical protein